jgi:hypothetical protein
MDLHQAEPLLVHETRMKMASLATLAPIKSKAQTLRDISRLFQAVAICKLLIHADTSAFRENLVRSAHARLYYLRHVKSEGADDDRFQGLSRTQAVFDAIVAGSPELAREIANLSTDQWHRGWEYEDDFCYYSFVHRLLVEPISRQPRFFGAAHTIRVRPRGQALTEAGLV